MTQSDVLKIIKEITELDELGMDTEGQWDSLQQLEILACLEKRFKVDIQDIRELHISNTPNKLLRVLKNNKIL